MPAMKDAEFVRTQVRSSLSWGFLLAGWLVPLSGCTDVVLWRYRDDELLATQTYALGERYAEIKGLRYCYQDYGQGDPVIILPGLGTSIDFWQLNIPVLAQEHRVLALDLPGFGKSAKPDVTYDLRWINDRVCEFMDAQGVPRASFIGGSMGGQLAMLMALDHPERVDKLVLMGSSGNWPDPGLFVNFALSVLWSEIVVGDFLRWSWPELYPKLFQEQTDVVRRIFRYQMAERADGVRFAPTGRAAARALKSIFYRQFRGRLDEVQRPVLLIWGAHDPVHPYEGAIGFRQKLTDARLVVVPDASHEVMLDQPAQFNNLVLRFLRSGTVEIQDDYPQ